MSDLLMEDTEICGECGCEYTTLLPYNENFLSGKIGRVKCPECGHVESPCDLFRGCELTDESGHSHDCDACPWRNAEIITTGKEG